MKRTAYLIDLALAIERTLLTRNHGGLTVGY